MTDDDRAALTHIAVAIAEAAKAGRWDDVEKLSVELRALRSVLTHERQLDSERLNVQAENTMHTETDKRSAAIAKAHAGKNKLLLAIANDKAGPGETRRWRSGTDYCRRRLKISPGSLTGYMDGTTPAPKHVVEKVAKDFPSLSWTWKKVAE